MMRQAFKTGYEDGLSQSDFKHCWDEQQSIEHTTADVDLKPVRYTADTVDIMAQPQLSDADYNERPLHIIFQSKRDRYTASSTDHLHVDTGHENSVVHYFSGACRVARSLETSNLASAHILHSLRDSDIERCHMYDTSRMSMISMLLVGLSSILRLEGNRTEEELLVVVWTALWSSFLLVNNFIANVSLYVLVSVYITLLGSALFYYLICLPRKSPVLKIWVFGGKKLPTYALLTRIKSEELLWRNLNLSSHFQARYTSFQRDSNPYTRISKADHINRLRVRLNIVQSTRNQINDPLVYTRDFSTGRFHVQLSFYALGSLSTMWLRERSQELAMFNIKHAEELGLFLDYDTGNKGYLEIFDIERLDQIFLKLDQENTGRVHLSVFIDWFLHFQIDMGLTVE
eukprot:gene4324-8607_t